MEINIGVLNWSKDKEGQQRKHLIRHNKTVSHVPTSSKRFIVVQIQFHFMDFESNCRYKTLPAYL